MRIIKKIIIIENGLERNVQAHFGVLPTYIQKYKLTLTVVIF